MNDIERAKAMLAGDTQRFHDYHGGAVHEYRPITEEEVLALVPGDRVYYGVDRTVYPSTFIGLNNRKGYSELTFYYNSKANMFGASIRQCVDRLLWVRL